MGSLSEFCGICICSNGLNFFLSLFAGKKDFLMVADVLNVKVIEVKDQVNLFERFIPKIYNSRVSAKIRLCVCHK